MSTSSRNLHLRVSSLLKAIDQPARLKILLAIGTGEACVCHLEAALGQRQVYISQQLMALREAHIILARRDGRFIYYRLRDPALLDLIRQAAQLAGVSEAEINARLQPEPTLCECPKCVPETAPV